MITVSVVCYSGAGHTAKMAEAVLAGAASVEGVNRLSVYFGAAGQAMQEPPDEKPNDEDKKTGHLLGVRVATITKRLKAS